MVLILESSSYIYKPGAHFKPSQMEAFDHEKQLEEHQAGSIHSPFRGGWVAVSAASKEAAQVKMGNQPQ